MLGGMELPLRIYQKKTQQELRHSQKTPQEIESPRSCQNLLIYDKLVDFELKARFYVSLEAFSDIKTGLATNKLFFMSLIGF